MSDAPNVSGSPVRTLVAGAIDYAGLFPPAGLSMNDAIGSYASYLESEDAWALGRFVVPRTRARELVDCASAAGLPRAGRPPFRLSLVSAAGPSAGRADIEPLDLEDIAVAEAIEVRAPSREWILATGPVSPGPEVFFEIAIESDPGPVVAAIKEVGGKAKVRTGGVTPDAFPTARDLARFVATCAREGVAFKATAGLHHPLRSRYRLTYDHDSPSGEMFGFINVLLAAAFARAELDEESVAALLTERDVKAFRFGKAGVSWREHEVSTDDLARARATLALSFGSCSFREPIDDLQALGLL